MTVLSEYSILLATRILLINFFVINTVLRHLAWLTSLNSTLSYWHYYMWLFFSWTSSKL